MAAVINNSPPEHIERRSNPGVALAIIILLVLLALFAFLVIPLLRNKPVYNTPAANNTGGASVTVPIPGSGGNGSGNTGGGNSNSGGTNPGSGNGY